MLILESIIELIRGAIEIISIWTTIPIIAPKNRNAIELLFIESIKLVGRNIENNPDRTNPNIMYR